jgi:DNA ligase (NAD+)
MINQKQLLLQTKQILQISSLSSDDAKSKIDELIQVLLDHNYCYYVLAAPIISDTEYDILFQLLLTRESKYPQHIQSHSPTQKISWQLNWFEKATHIQPLLSLQNTYNSTDIDNRYASLENAIIKYAEIQQSLTMSIEAKMDGTSVALTYINGELTQAITRWDWTIGEDITSHAKYLLWLPHKLDGKSPELLVIRWEILMPKSALERLNAFQQEHELPMFANTRNAVAWTLRNLDPKLVQKRGLTVLLYDILYTSNNIKTQQQAHTNLRERWLPVVDFCRYIDTIQNIKQICEDPNTIKTLTSKRYETDGLVIKLDNIPLRDVLGSTHHHPRRAMAYKFPSKQVTAKLIDVEYQVGRSGVITPVAMLDPVQLGGVTISKASLHNFDNIATLDVRIGDQVWLQRSGEVIPYILWPVLQVRDGSEHIIKTPTHCPVCSSILEQEVWYVARLCKNPDCPAIIKQSLIHAVSKNCLDIRGLADATIELLVDNAMIRTISDLYILKEPQYKMQLRLLPWLWDKKIDQILTSIQQSLTQPLWKRIHAMGIFWVGIQSSKQIALIVNQAGIYLPTQVLTFIKTYDWHTIHGLWNNIAQAMQEFASDIKNIAMREILEQQGLIFEKMDTSMWPLLWKYFVITWTFEQPRSVLVQQIQQRWWEVVSGVSKKITAVLVWNNPWSKYQQAIKLEIITFTQLEEMYNHFVKS